MDSKLIQSVSEATHAAADKGLETLEKVAVQVADKLEPVIDKAREKVDDLQPKLDSAVAAVADGADKAVAASAAKANEVAKSVDTAAKRGRAKVAKSARRAEKKARKKGKEIVAAVEAPVAKRRRGKVAKFTKVVTVGALLAGAAAALRQYIATKDSGWQAHEPSGPYLSPPKEDIADNIADDISTGSEKK